MYSAVSNNCYIIVVLLLQFLIFVHIIPSLMAEEKQNQGKKILLENSQIKTALLRKETRTGSELGVLCGFQLLHLMGVGGIRQAR